MAKNYSYTRSLTDKLAIKGELSEDGKTIKYIDENKEESIVSIDKCFEPFKSEFIELTIAVKMNQDLGDDSVEE